MTKRTLEVSGKDFSGKSTQAELFTYGTPKYIKNFGGLGNFSNLFPRGLNANESWNWWFRDTSLGEMAHIIFSAYKARRLAIKNSDVDVAIAERGLLMCKAQIAGIFATRREISVIEVYDEVDAKSPTSAVDSDDAAPTELVLTTDSYWQDTCKYLQPFTRNLETSSSNYTSMQNSFYIEYLSNLDAAIDLSLRQDSVKSAITVTVDAPAIDIHNQMRNHPALDDIFNSVLLPNLDKAVGLVGLSESGKSRIATELQDDWHFTRLKLGYFNEISRCGSKYADPEVIARNIIRFLSANKHLSKVTLESFYNPSLAAYLKLMLGSRWITVLLTTSAKTRQERLLQVTSDVDYEKAIDEQKKKDAEKLSQGIMLHEQFSDIVLSNEDDLRSTVETIIKYKEVPT